MLIVLLMLSFYVGTPTMIALVAYKTPPMPLRIAGAVMSVVMAVTVLMVTRP